MITCILLAAGSGSRFGSQKLLARLPDGRRIVEASVATLRLAGAGPVIAVARCEPALVEALENCGCEVVINENADQGMGTSLAAGVAAARDASGWIIALGDMPSIRVDTIKAILGALHAGACIAVPVVGGKRGHPVGFAAPYLPKLLSLQGDTGAREILNVDASHIEEIEVEDAGILADIDTLGDLEDLEWQILKTAALRSAQNPC